MTDDVAATCWTHYDRRDATTRTADTWPSHKARARARRLRVKRLNRKASP